MGNGYICLGILFGWRCFRGCVMAGFCLVGWNCLFCWIGFSEILLCLGSYLAFSQITLESLVFISSILDFLILSQIISNTCIIFIKYLYNCYLIGLEFIIQILWDWRFLSLKMAAELILDKAYKVFKEWKNSCLELAGIFFGLITYCSFGAYEDFSFMYFFIVFRKRHEAH